MSLAFAILRPTNRKAINVFSDVVDFIRDHPSHARFLANRGPRSTSLDLDLDNAVIELSLEQDKAPEFPPVGWRMGRAASGSRPNTADICLALPGTQDVGTAHGRLFLHPRSGLLVLEASDDARFPTYYLTRAQKKVLMEPKQTLPLIEPTTTIIIAGAEYQISYTVDDEKAKGFFGPLGDFLFSLKQGGLHQAGYVSNEGLGDGTFGDVSYGINIRTGDVVAIKEVRVRGSREREALCMEIQILEMLQDSPLFIHLLDSWCDKHEVAPGDCPGSQGSEHYYLILDLALYSFGDIDFPQLPDDEALELFRQTLDGVFHLHRLGIMHRDITCNNMMVMSRSPLQAVLIDFGKAIKGNRSAQTTIGPIPTLAPEVWRKDYDHRIDLWAWAYAGAQWLGYRPRPEQRNQQITEARLGEIRAYLDSLMQQYHTTKPRLRTFAMLLKSILIWERQERIDTREALEHEVWFTSVNEPNEGPQSKKAKLEASSTVSTVPFSEEE